MKNLKGSSKYIIKLALILLIITAVVALLLGLVNYITEDRIEAINREKTRKAMSEVLMAESYEPVDFSDATGIVLNAYKAISGGEVMGYVVETGPTGFGGVIDMVVGVSAEGSVTGISIISMSETSGLGTNADKDSFKTQFIGGSSFAVDKDGGDIDSLTGATVTTRAVAEGVNAAVKCAENLA